MPSLPVINPPILNTACLWASSRKDFEALYTSPYTGAVTTRTASHPTQGFSEDSEIHRHTFSIASSRARTTTTFHPSEPPANGNQDVQPGPLSAVSSLNTYGYSPLSLSDYISMAWEFEQIYPEITKPVIFSVTGTSEDVFQCWKLLTENHHSNRSRCMEINLSCPNIAGKPPPAYSRGQLLQFMVELKDRIIEHVNAYIAEIESHAEMAEGGWPGWLARFKIPLGIKLPPYTYSGQFDELVAAIKEINNTRFHASSKPPHSDIAQTVKHLNITSGDQHLQNEIFDAPWPVAFITAVNTLGSSMIMEQADSGDWQPTLFSDKLNSTYGLGGLAGASLHPLALGNVRNLYRRISAAGSGLGDVKIIGVGGVSDAAGATRMRAAGADIVGLATALGVRGVTIFQDIAQG